MPLVDVPEADAAAEQHPPAVRREPEVAEQAVAVDEHATLRAEPAGQLERQFLGRDDVARDRHDAALQVGRERSGIAVGGDDHLGGLQRPAGGREVEAGRAAAQAPHARMAVQQRAGGLRGRAQPGVEAGRMQPARRLDHDPAVVAVRADLLALALARHHTDAVGALAERRDLARQDRVLPGVAGELETAAALGSRRPAPRARSGPPGTRTRRAPRPGAPPPGSARGAGRGSASRA